MPSTLLLICYRISVCPSVCHTERVNNHQSIQMLDVRSLLTPKNVVNSNRVAPAGCPVHVKLENLAISDQNWNETD